MPSADQLAQMQTTFASMFKDLKIDLWVEKDTSLLRKATIVANVVPPTAPTGDTTGSSSLSGCDTSGSGITSVSLDVTLQLDPNQTVTVEAPASAKTYEDLQADIQANPGLLGPLGSMFSGSSSSQ
jgi:hypothetical protein